MNRKSRLKKIKYSHHNKWGYEAMKTEIHSQIQKLLYMVEPFNELAI